MNIKIVKSGGWMAASGIGLWLWVWYMFDSLGQHGPLVSLLMMLSVYGGLILVGAGLLRSIIGLLLKSNTQNKPRSK